MAGYRRVLCVVLDSVGCGELPDAARYGDVGAHTLGHTADAAGGLHLPNLAALGLGNLAAVTGVPPNADPKAWWGRMAARSPGKDTTTGHWELAGLVLEQPFPIFPDGFPDAVIDAFVAHTGRGVLGNVPASGTEILDRLGPEHQRTGKWIVYTSADSVFQVAAHTDVIPLDELDRACRYARELLDPYQVGRVISRPFVGTPGAYERTYDRHDYSMLPPAPTVLDRLQGAGVPVVGVGKIASIFADRGVDISVHTAGNREGVQRSLEALAEYPSAFVFTNLVDFDMLWGHRRDPDGYARALEEFDTLLPQLLAALGEDTLLLITADHGCDPTFLDHTDHTREYVPILMVGAGLGGGCLGTRESFADVAATIAEVHGLGPLPVGRSLL